MALATGLAEPNRDAYLSGAMLRGEIFDAGQPGAIAMGLFSYGTGMTQLVRNLEILDPCHDEFLGGGGLRVPPPETPSARPNASIRFRRARPCAPSHPAAPPPTSPSRRARGPGLSRPGGPPVRFRHSRGGRPPRPAFKPAGRRHRRRHFPLGLPPSDVPPFPARPAAQRRTLDDLAAGPRYPPNDSSMPSFAT